MQNVCIDYDFKCLCTFNSVLQDTKAKIQKMKVYQESLMECLGDILEKHVPFPQNDSSTNKKKKVQQPVLCLTVFYALQSVDIKETCAVAWLTVFCFHSQNIAQESDEDLISLNEILEVGSGALHPLIALF